MPKGLVTCGRCSSALMEGKAMGLIVVTCHCLPYELRAKVRTLLETAQASQERYASTVHST